MNQADNNLPTPAEARAKLWDMIKDIRFAMFTTRHSNGHLHARPMTTQNKNIDEDSRLWFFMSRADGTVDAFAHAASVNVVCGDPC